MPKYTIRKYGGDDLYSWALFRDGAPIMTGMSRREAQYERDAMKKRAGTKKDESSGDDNE